MEITASRKTDIACPLCGGDTYTVYMEPQQDVSDPRTLYGAASGVRGTQRLVRCTTCSLLYENPRYAEAVILDGYAQSDEAGHDSQYVMRRKSFQTALHNYRAHLPAPPAKLLDVGAAGGAFLDAARMCGYEAQGVEPSASLAASARARGIDVREGTLEDARFPEQSFDVVTFWDVVEHVTDPVALLRRAHRLLKDDGVLLINFPDVGTPLARLAGHKFWWFLSVHLTHFSRDTITRLCDTTGFDSVYIAPYWQTLEFGYLVTMAQALGVPLAGSIHTLLPGVVRRIPMSYYASQTTLIARKRAQ